jgi:hypothetical protein
MRPVTVVMSMNTLRTCSRCWQFAINSQSRHGPNGSNEPFRHRVPCWRLWRRSHNVQAGAAKDRVEPTREFLVAISDEKLRWVDLLSEGPRELAGLLRHAVRIGMARAAR